MFEKMPEDIKEKVRILLKKMGGLGIEVYSYVYTIQEQNEKLEAELKRERELSDYQLHRLFDKGEWIDNLYLTLNSICKDYYNTCKELGKDITNGKTLEEWTEEYIENKYCEVTEGEVNDEADIA